MPCRHPTLPPLGADGWHDEPTRWTRRSPVTSSASAMASPSSASATGSRRSRWPACSASSNRTSRGSRSEAPATSASEPSPAWRRCSGHAFGCPWRWRLRSGSRWRVSTPRGLARRGRARGGRVLDAGPSGVVDCTGFGFSSTLAVRRAPVRAALFCLPRREADLADGESIRANGPEEGKEAWRPVR